MQEVKNLQMDHEHGDTLLGIGKAIGATLKSLAQGQLHHQGNGGSYP